MQWIAQIADDAGGSGWTWKERFNLAISSGAKACYLHGAYLDDLYHDQNAFKLAEIVESVHSLGVPVGLAGHDPRTHDWAHGLDIPIAFHWDNAPFPKRSVIP